MDKVLLIVHIAGAILFLGPATAGAEIFQRVVGQAGQEPAARAFHRMTRIYGSLSLVVPVVGIILAIRNDVMDQAWVSISMLLTIIIAVLLWRVIVDQARALGNGAAPARLRALTGLFSLSWVVILVLMVWKPG